MRRQLVGAVAGLALVLALPGEARPATGAPKTPPPTVAVSMTTPTGNQPNPTLDAGWNVTRPGIEGALWVEGKTADTPGASEEPVLPGPAPFATTIAATWTSNLLTVKSHSITADIVLWWSDGIPPGATGSRQLLQVRYCDAKGHWGRWTSLYDKPFTDSTTTFLTTGGPAPEFLDPLKYPGKVPAKKIRVQFRLTDTLPQGSLLEQTLNIDLDPASHGQL
jgi:hypothetical protein